MTILHVWTPLSVTAFAYGAMMIPAVDEGDFEQARDEGRRAGREPRQRGRARRDGRDRRGTYEGTWHAIVECAKTHNAALIVIGARGLSTFQSVFLGSVSHGVVQHAHPAPCWSCRRRPAPRGRPRRFRGAEW